MAMVGKYRDANNLLHGASLWHNFLAGDYDMGSEREVWRNWAQAQPGPDNIYERPNVKRAQTIRDVAFAASLED